MTVKIYNMEFRITHQDYENSGKDYSNQSNCPFKVACNRQYPDRKIAEVYAGTVYNEKFKLIATIEPWFCHADYEQLIKSKQDFITEITFINENEPK